MLRAERSAAALRFARNTGGQVCKTLQSETMGEVGFEPTKAKPTDLQSVLVDHLSIRPDEPKKLNEILNVRV